MTAVKTRAHQRDTKPVCVESRGARLSTRACPLLSSGAGRRHRSISAARARAAANQLRVAAAIDRQDRRTDTVPLRRRSPLEAARRQNHCRYLINVINRVPAVWDGSFILLQFRPTADTRQLQNAAADRPRFVDSSMTVPRHSMT